MWFHTGACTNGINVGLAANAYGVNILSASLEPTGTTIVNISNAHTVSGVNVLDVVNLFGITNTLVDQNKSFTSTAVVLGEYFTDALPANTTAATQSAHDNREHLNS